ncbi:MAG: type I restriction enzyme HsdR N-terminal domain-containing protein [Helicobacter sp.]|nr:type I restriction enzyme HsdR N-terminal domain-containing protein [Helicobacter sp.]
MFDFDFGLLENENFKEDSVREFVVAPLLQSLGFVLKDDKNPSRLQMILSKRERADFKIGSNKKIEADLMPDYALYVDSKIHCVLDAKAPRIDVAKDSEAYKQALSYAVGFKAKFFALCNGYTFMLFRLEGQEVILELDLQNDLQEKWNLLRAYLGDEAISSLKKEQKSEEWYLSRELPKAIIKPQKRKKARHYGCLAYFTRQSWDIVTQNIKNFTSEGDVVLDPFGGSGVTAIEAMMNGRIGIHVDLNPLSVFMAKALSAKVDLGKLYDMSEEILNEFENLRPKNEREAKNILKHAQYYSNAIDSEFGEVATQKEQDSVLWIPQDEPLPKGSDVDSVLGLFSKVQLAELALLRKLIFKHTTPSGSKEQRIDKRNLRYSLMLAFYNTLTTCNLTYHISEHKGLTDKAGDSGIFRYYRYRIAKNPTFVDIIESFKGKLKRVCKGKQELENAPSDSFYQSYFAPLENVIKDFKGAMLNQRENLAQSDSRVHKSDGAKIFQADATNLQEIESGSVDFIYTDPPYGAKIPYLDLSTMWNAWLDFPVDSDLKEKECIEKGSLEKSRYEYYDLMKASLKEMYRVLKWNRWLAFVFQHQDPKLFQILVESAENVGFEYAGSMSQENTGIASFKKVQNPTRVLKGQLILYFKKIDNPKTRVKIETGTESLEQLYKDVESVIVANNGATLEAINAHLVKMAIEGGYYLLMGKFQNVLLLINERFDYDSETKLYHIRDEASILNYGIPIEERARYYIVGELTKAQRENRGISFDKLCLYVIPLLKNGIQANHQLIKEILNEIATEDETAGEWRLKGEKGAQGNFDF